MASFRDSANRLWNVEITVADIRHVRQACNVDLAKAVEGKLFVRLAGDPCKLVDVLFALCRDQASKLGVSDEQFAQAMAGDAIADAAQALIEAVGFFSSGLQRKALLELAQKSRHAGDLAAQRLLDTLQSEQFDAAIATRLDRQQEAMLAQLRGDDAPSPPDASGG